MAAVKAVGGQPVWQTQMEPADMGAVGRAAVVDFDGTGRAGVVVGDMRGKLVALADDGQVRWRYDMHSSSDLRGLDSIIRGQGATGRGGGHWTARWSRSTATARRSGRFPCREACAACAPRSCWGRARAPCCSAAKTGTLTVLDGATGQTLWTASLGQAITEIRLAELDGDPGTRELVAGGKRNGVWAYSQSGARLFSASVGGDKTKITEIAALDVDDSGKDVVAIGDDTGTVTFFDAKGTKLTTASYSAPINRMATGKIGGERQFLVADAHGCAP